MAKAPRRTGRPTRRTPEVTARIIEGLSAGTPLTTLCEPDDMPGVRTVYDWMDADEKLSADIARAREIGHDAIAVEGLKIVDNTEEDPASRRVRADYRLKLLAKWDPKRYGEKVDHTSSDGTMTPKPTRIIIEAAKAEPADPE